MKLNLERRLSGLVWSEITHVSYCLFAYGTISALSNNIGKNGQIFMWHDVNIMPLDITLVFVNLTFLPSITQIWQPWEYLKWEPR